MTGDLERQLSDLRRATRELTGQVQVLSRAIREVNELRQRTEELDGQAKVLETQATLGVIHALDAVASLEEVKAEIRALTGRVVTRKELAVKHLKRGAVWAGAVALTVYLSANLQQIYLNKCVGRDRQPQMAQTCDAVFVGDIDFRPLSADPIYPDPSPSAIP